MRCTASIRLFQLEAPDLGENAMSERKTILSAGKLALCLAAVAAASGGALTQSGSPSPSFPNQPVRIIVPFGAGSNTDLQARIIADKLAGLWRQSVVVENRPGIAGTASVAAAAADGHTLMLTSSGHTIARVLFKNLQFDPVKDFAGITQVTSVPAVLASPPELPAKDVKEFIALAKAKPGVLNYASAGTASTSYLAGEMFKQFAHIDIVHIPYKGAPEALNSILRNDAQLYFMSANLSTELIASGKIKALAISSASRSPMMPNIPTVGESGLPGYAYDNWFGIMAPAGVPRPIVMKLNADIVSVLKMPDVAQKMQSQGLVVTTQSPDEFDKMIKSEAERYGKILRDAGIGG
jgi:tripartite-type tricarboxylate transporter receptor subunit TctC